MAIRDELRAFKKERILEEATQLFYERGYRGTSLDAIAERLNVTKPFIYYHFSSKSDLLLAIYRRVVDLSIGCVRTARTIRGTPTERLRNFAFDYTHLVIREQPIVAIFFREESNIPERHVREINELKGRFDDELSKLLAEGVRKGEFEVSDVRLATLAVVGMMSWIYLWYRDSGRLDADAIAEQMADFTCRVVGVHTQLRGSAGTQ